MDEHAPYFFIAYETTDSDSENTIVEVLGSLKAIRVLQNLYRVPGDSGTLHGIAGQLQCAVDLDTLRLVVFEIDGKKSIYIHHPRDPR